MAILTGGILGPVRKKVGNVVGSTWKGINVVRQMPAHVHNPNSEEQQVVRSKFRIASKLASSVLDFAVKPFWDKRAVRMSGYNLMIQKQLERVKDKETIEINDIIFSEGCVLVAELSESLGEAGIYTLYIDAVSSCLSPDVSKNLYVVAVNNDTFEVLGTAFSEFAESMTVAFECLNFTGNSRITFFAFAGNPSTGRTTETVQIGSVAT